jgi:hypothetical protein
MKTPLQIHYRMEKWELKPRLTLTKQSSKTTLVRLQNLNHFTKPQRKAGRLTNPTLMTRIVANTSPLRPNILPLNPSLR